MVLVSSRRVCRLPELSEFQPKWATGNQFFHTPRALILGFSSLSGPNRAHFALPAVQYTLGYLRLPRPLRLNAEFYPNKCGLGELFS